MTNYNGKKTLKDYYKTKIYEFGYNMGSMDEKLGHTDNLDVKDDIYFNDEMDYYICADYFGSYVGEDRNWTQEDLDFLEVLGFASGDFIEENE